MLRPGCRQLRAAGRSHWLAGATDLGSSLPVPTAARAAVQPGSVRARPASPRPPAGAGHAGAASPLAGPGRGRRGARDPDGLCPAAGRARVWGRRTGPAHVTPAALSSWANSAAGAGRRWRGSRPSFGSRWPREGSCWLRLCPGAAPGPSDPQAGHAAGEVENDTRSQVYPGVPCRFPFRGAPLWGGGWGASFKRSQIPKH